MKEKFFFSFMVLFFFTYTGFSQTIYHFEYKFHQQDDSVVYQVFLVAYDNGSGMARIRYQLPGSMENQLVEMKVQSSYFSKEPGVIDTNKIVYTTSDPDFRKGYNNLKFTAPVFWYEKNKELDIFEPKAVSDSAYNMATILKAEYIQKADLGQEMVLNFFSDEDAIFKNLFGIASRGGPGLSAIERNTKIHLLIVANTNDPSIGSSCGKDMNRIENTFDDLADFLDITIYPTKIFGKTYSKKNIEQAIKDIKPSSNDIVIFYYSGHGFRKKDRPRPAKPFGRFPFLDFREKETDDYNVFSLNVQDIFETIKKKGARLTLVLSDCCNYDPESTNSVAPPEPTHRGSGLEWVLDNCRALFLNPQRQAILATSADIGQLACGNNNFGGFFSHYFKTSMETHFSSLKSNVNWSQVLNDAKTQTTLKAQNSYCAPSVFCKQNPYFEPKIAGLGN